MANSTTCCIPKLGAWLDLGLLQVLAAFWLVSLPSWVGSLWSSGSELVKGTGSELPSQLQNKQKSQFSAVSYATLCWAAKCGSVPQANEWHGGKLVMQLKTDIGSELLLTSSNVTHPGLAAVKVDMVQHSTSHADNRDRLSERETLLKAFNPMHSVIKINTYLCMVNGWGWKGAILH